MTTYSIDDGHGNRITAGLSERLAPAVAQRLANERGESVWLYDATDRGGEAEEVTPELMIRASNARPSTCLDVDGARDVDVVVTLGAREVEGEVTLVPASGTWQRGCIPLQAYGGQPDHWVSGDLLRVLRTLDDRAFRAALQEIERAAVEAAS